jgi:hypothetical protein
LPKTPLGKWSVWLIAAFVLLLVAFQLLVVTGQRGGETFLDNLLLTIPIFLAGICGISSLITGLIGIIKSKERSFLVFLATIIGLFVSVFVIGEITIPH